MITRTENGYTVYVNTGTHPANDYVETVNSIVNVLQSQNTEVQADGYHLLGLLKEMLPTFEQARAMMDAD